MMSIIHLRQKKMYRMMPHSWETARLVKYLLHKHEDLNSLPNTCVQSQACWHVLLTPALGNHMQVDPRGPKLPDPNERVVSKTKVDSTT